MKAAEADALEAELLQSTCSELELTRIGAKHGLSPHWLARFVGARGIRSRCKAMPGPGRYHPDWTT
jgi:hypothetical protein